MNATTRFLIPTLAAGALLLPACAGTFDLALGEKGSGVAETTTFDVGSFDAVEVGNAFEATIELVDGPSTVEITVDDNFTDDLDVEVKNGRLEIGFDRGVHRVKVDPKVVITVPSLNHVDASGAASITVEGVMADPEVRLDASGASHVQVEVETDSLDVDASGASSITVGGTADRLVLDASGASEIDLDGVVATTGRLDASGASTISIGDVEDVSGDLSGASTLQAPGDAVGRVETSGASNIDRR